MSGASVEETRQVLALVDDTLHGVTAAAVDRVLRTATPASLDGRGAGTRDICDELGIDPYHPADDWDHHGDARVVYDDGHTAILEPWTPDVPVAVTGHPMASGRGPAWSVAGVLPVEDATGRRFSIETHHWCDPVQAEDLAEHPCAPWNISPHLFGAAEVCPRPPEAKATKLRGTYLQSLTPEGLAVCRRVAPREQVAVRVLPRSSTASVRILLGLPCPDRSGDGTAAVPERSGDTSSDDPAGVPGPDGERHALVSMSAGGGKGRALYATLAAQQTGDPRREVER